MRFLSIILLCLALAMPAFAKEKAPTGGFDGPGSMPSVTKASQVQGAADKAYCVLEGFIVEKIHGKKSEYLFKDASGTVYVEIKNKIFAGHTIKPDMRVRLKGMVDKELLSKNVVEIDNLEVLP